MRSKCISFAISSRYSDHDAVHSSCPGSLAVALPSNFTEKWNREGLLTEVALYPPRMDVEKGD